MRTEETTTRSCCNIINKLDKSYQDQIKILLLQYLKFEKLLSIKEEFDNSQKTPEEKWNLYLENKAFIYSLNNIGLEELIGNISDENRIQRGLRGPTKSISDKAKLNQLLTTESPAQVIRKIQFELVNNQRTRLITWEKRLAKDKSLKQLSWKDWLLSKTKTFANFVYHSSLASTLRDISTILYNQVSLPKTLTKPFYLLLNYIKLDNTPYIILILNELQKKPHIYFSNAIGACLDVLFGIPHLAYSLVKMTANLGIISILTNRKYNDSEATVTFLMNRYHGKSTTMIMVSLIGGNLESHFRNNRNYMLIWMMPSLVNALILELAYYHQKSTGRFFNKNKQELLQLSTILSSFITYHATKTGIWMHDEYLINSATRSALIKFMQENKPTDTELETIEPSIWDNMFIIFGKKPNYVSYHTKPSLRQNRATVDVEYEGTCLIHPNNARATCSKEIVKERGLTFIPH